MSYLLFLDESGHDHRECPYEVRGGIAIHASKLWQFTKDIHEHELFCFGSDLHKYKIEMKGSKFLKRRVFKNAQQMPIFDDEIRRNNVLSFFNKNLSPEPKHTKEEFTSYSQACLLMVEGIFEILYKCDAKIFASMIPRGIEKPAINLPEDFLRKDQVFLLERYYHFLESKDEDGLIVMDETDKALDRDFVSKLQSYFSRTQQGRLRATRILPSPFFVSSDMAYAIQVADIAIYCINWGFRLESFGVNAEDRMEIREKFSPWINKLQFHGEKMDGDKKYLLHGIVFVPDPYESRSDRGTNKKGEASTLTPPKQVMPASSLT